MAGSLPPSWKLVGKLYPTGKTAWRGCGLPINAFYLVRLDHKRDAIVASPSQSEVIQEYLDLLVVLLRYLDMHRRRATLVRALEFAWVENGVRHRLTCLRGEVLMVCGLLWKAKIEDGGGPAASARDAILVARILLSVALPQVRLWPLRIDGPALPMFCTEHMHRAALATCLLNLQVMCISHWENSILPSLPTVKRGTDTTGASLCKWAGAVAMHLIRHNSTFHNVAYEMQALMLFFAPGNSPDERRLLITEAKKRFEKLAHHARVQQCEDQLPTDNVDIVMVHPNDPSELDINTTKGQEAARRVARRLIPISCSESYAEFSVPYHPTDEDEKARLIQQHQTEE